MTEHCFVYCWLFYVVYSFKVLWFRGTRFSQTVHCTSCTFKIDWIERHAIQKKCLCEFFFFLFCNVVFILIYIFISLKFPLCYNMNSHISKRTSAFVYGTSFFFIEAQSYLLHILLRDTVKNQIGMSWVGSSSVCLPCISTIQKQQLSSFFFIRCFFCLRKARK